MSTYDPQDNGFLDEDGFVGFFKDSLLINKKVEAIWDNLTKMGIRNDLKRVEDGLKYAKKEVDKSSFPRYCLSKDPEFFEALEKMMDITPTLANEGYNFINLLMTNSKIYQQIIKLKIDDESKNFEKVIDPLSNNPDEKIWPKIFDNKNNNKLLYTLQIVESIIEDIELYRDNIDSNDHDLALFEEENLSLENIKNLKNQWLNDFFTTGGFDYLNKV